MHIIVSFELVIVKGVGSIIAIVESITHPLSSIETVILPAHRFVSIELAVAVPPLKLY